VISIRNYFASPLRLLVRLCFVWEAVTVTYTLTGLKSIYTAEIQTLAYTKVLEQTREMLVPVSKFLCSMPCSLIMQWCVVPNCT
jgi:hypothetical protein